MRGISLPGLAILTAMGGPGQSVKAPAFAVVSVKRHVIPANAYGFGNGSAIRISGNRVTLTQATLGGLLLSAFNVKDYQISGAPTAGDFYDITAETEGEATPTLDQVRPMLQTMLADRFKLKLHRDTKELPVYDLVAGKDGHKLKESLAGTGHAVSTRFSGSMTRVNFASSSLSDLAGFLSVSITDRPVLDKTGLKGNYDFTLEFTRDSADSTGTSIFTAVQEQLGLKLDGAKEPTEILVVDHMEKPSEN